MKQFIFRIYELRILFLQIRDRFCTCNEAKVGWVEDKKRLAEWLEKKYPVTSLIISYREIVMFLAHKKMTEKTEDFKN